MFDYLKGKHLKRNRDSRIADINIVADTHCHERHERGDWGEEWSNNENNSFFSLGTKNQKGVAILINDKFREKYPDMTITHIDIDPNGRYVKFILTVNSFKYRILGLYAPTKGPPRVIFFQRLMKVIDDGVHDAENLFGGDYNCVHDDALDRLNCVSDKNDLGIIDLRYLMKVFGVEDIWRRRNPDKKEYTWRGREGKLSRIDYWLTSTSLSCQIKNVSHTFAPKTDHSAVDLLLNPVESSRGPGIWKMNSELLLNNDYRQEFTNLWTKWKQKRNRYSDIKLWWDLGKKHIKSFTMQYAKEHSFKNKNKLNDLQSKLNELNKENEEYSALQKEYEDIFESKTKGARVRSKVKWWEEGEKSTKYFYNLEKQNAKEKSWDQIYGRNKEVITGNSNIQKRQVEFYKELYSTQNLSENTTETNYFLGENNDLPKLSEESKVFMDAEIQLTELANALKMTKNNKSPGPDGIVFEFYKLFWGVIGNDMYEVLKTGLQEEELAYSQYLAAIILLYKKGPRPDIRNWRPISLLNTDYKLLSKVFAERLKKVLKEIIHSDQKGCIPGRYIGENIRLIDDILFEIENQSPESVIMQLDQEKAFDRVEWKWLFDTLKRFNFGDVFINNLKTLYKNAQSCVITNGYQSEYFSISRGIRQGDSLSALLYILQFEPLMQKIRSEKKIPGVSLELRYLNKDKIVSKGCQYVDDSNTVLKDIHSAKPFFDILNKYERVSGSKINIDKTVCLAIKQMKNPFDFKLTISTGPERVLGVPLGSKRENDSFWTDLTQKLKAKLQIWRMRDLSYEGKALIIRSMAVSKIENAITMISIKDEHIKDILKIIYEFLWAGKNYKISRQICSLPRDLGGLNIINIKALIKAKRVQWIIRALKDTSGQNWSKIIENYIRCLDNNFGIEFFSLKVTDSSHSIKPMNIPPFYKECISNFQEMLRIGTNRKNNEILWCNDRYLFNGKPIEIRHWSRDGIKLIGDIYTDGRMDENKIKNQLSHIGGYYFEIKQIKKACPQIKDNLDEENDVIAWNKNALLQQIFNVPRIGPKTLEQLSSKDIYTIFNQGHNITIPSNQYWIDKLNNPDIDWAIWFKVNFNNNFLPRPCKDYNFRVFHGPVRTENKLRYMKDKDGKPYSPDGKCVVCKSGVNENVEHVLYECSFIGQIWVLTEQLISLIKSDFEVNKENAITGYRPSEVNKNVFLINVILSITRFHLWKIRNRIRYNKEELDFKQSYEILKWRWKNHLSLLKSSESNDQQLIQCIEGMENSI